MSQNQTNRKFMTGFATTTYPFTTLRKGSNFYLVKSLYFAVCCILMKGFYVPFAATMHCNCLVVKLNTGVLAHILDQDLLE